MLNRALHSVSAKTPDYPAQVKTTNLLLLVAVLLLLSFRAKADTADNFIPDAHSKHNETQCTLVPSMLEQAERLADSLATPSTASKGRSAHTIACIDSLAQIASTVHQISLGCGYRLTSMMSKAAANAATSLRAAQNVLLFRMGVRDTKAFLREARIYYDQERQVR
jgi:hypothetical protein